VKSFAVAIAIEDSQLRGPEYLLELIRTRTTAAKTWMANPVMKCNQNGETVRGD
jgi:hypothetical protein